MQQHSNSTYPFQARSLGSKRKKPIEVCVSAGSFSNPYYMFKNKKGKQSKAWKSIQAKDIASGELTKHQHIRSISSIYWNQPATRQIKLKGNGDYKNGIINSEIFTLTIRKKHRKNFSTSGRLFFYCTSHPSMLDDFIIDAGRRRSQQHISEETFETPQHATAAKHIEHQQLTSQAGTFPLMTAAPWATGTTTWDSAITILNIRP